MGAVTRRGVAAGAACGAAALLMAACGGATGGSGQGAGAAGGQKLTGSFELWQPWPIEQPTHGGPVGWKQLLDGYNGKGGTQMNLVTPATTANETFELKVQAAFAGGAPPDAFQCDHTWMPVWASKGFSLPLDDLMKRDKWDRNQLFASAIESMQWQGKFYAMMRHPSVVFMWWGTELMEANGIDTRTLPTTWAGVDELAARLSKKQGADWDHVGFVPHLGSDWAHVLPHANGAKLLSDDGRKAQLDSPEAIETIEWMKTHLKKLGSFADIDKWRREVPGAGGGGPKIFGLKKMGIIVGGNWIADDIRRVTTENNTSVRFTVSPIPSGPKGPRDPKTNLFAGAQQLSARKGTPKLDLVWEFFKYVSSKEGGMHVQRNTADVAANKEAAYDPSIVNDPLTGLGRKQFLPLFDVPKGGTRNFKHPAAGDIAREYLRPINAYLRDQTGTLREEMREANKLAQGHIDAFWAANPQPK